MKWQIGSKAPSAFLKRFSEYSPLIAQLLHNRGLKSQKTVDEFFNPDYQKNLHDPFLLKDMRKAVKRIFEAIQKNQKIIIYGDFDADGVCSTAVLFLTFKKLGAQNFDIYIPDREKEGHGLNKDAIRMLKRTGTELIVTVDCASTDFEEVGLAKSLGIDVVITDHHQLRDTSPDVVALINPFRKGDQYPFKSLAGAGVAYKLACALLSSKESESNHAFKKWLLDLVAIATVADVMPIIGENRTLVKYGLGVLAQTKWLGLRKLMELAQISPQVIQASTMGRAPVTSLDGHTLGFVLGPRLNAAGRMNHANNAFLLLVTDDAQEAERLAQQLNQSNTARQRLTDKIVQEIRKRVDEKFARGDDPKLIFEGSPEWPVGLVGLAASKVADKYHRPAVVYQEKEESIFASCRSIPQFDLMDMIQQCTDFLDTFGGHKGGAGFRMKKDGVEEVGNIFHQFAVNKLKDEDLTPVLNIDAEISLEDINWQNYEQIQYFSPFGRANAEPIFLARGLEVSDLRTVGKNDQHLKLELVMFNKQSSKAKAFKAIGFRLGDRRETIQKGDLLDVAFDLIVNEWNGYRNLEMKILDLKLTKIPMS